MCYDLELLLGDVAQLGERRLCKPEVASSILVVSTENRNSKRPVTREEIPRCGIFLRSFGIVQRLGEMV